ncbi:MAG: SDR family oxidoreductase [Bacteroidota bacterium]|nr:SDR family oxidoreductase [Bacteroidota bacterium]
MNILIIGASRGLGHAMSIGLNGTGRHLYLVSRSQPPVIENNKAGYTWIEADVAHSSFTQILKQQLQTIAIDVLIYNAAIWEKNTFRDNYQLTDDSEDELRNIININLTGAIITVQALLPNLEQATSSKIIFIGSTSGVDGNRTKAVAYSASKFGLRGVNNALRENFRGTNINSTILNLGDLSTTIPFEEGKEAVVKKAGYTIIPVQEVIDIIELIMQLSPATLVKEMDVPGLHDEVL